MSKVQYIELLRASEFGLLPRGDERQATPCGPHRGDGVEVGHWLPYKSGSAQVELALRGDDERGRDTCSPRGRHEPLSVLRSKLRGRSSFEAR